MVCPLCYSVTRRTDGIDITVIVGVVGERGL
jgi:hypothetical protein